jgi:hypothetical protein
MCSIMCTTPEGIRQVMESHTKERTLHIHFNELFIGGEIMERVSWWLLAGD